MGGVVESWWVEIGGVVMISGDVEGVGGREVWGC